MKLGGLYKFKTQAIINNYISLYVKLEFFSEGEQISRNAFASIISKGNITEAMQLGSYQGASNYTRGYDDYENEIDLSPEVKLTLIAVNGLGRVVYKREFPNYLQYSIHAPSRKAIFDNLVYNETNYPEYSFVLAQFAALIDINPDNTFSIYGMISPNYHFNLDLFASSGISSRIVPCVFPAYFPVFSFKDYEDLVEIGEPTYTVFDSNQQQANLIGSTLIEEIRYMGGGLWVSQSVDNNPTHAANGYYINSSLTHVYPDTQTIPAAGFPVPVLTPFTPAYSFSSSYYTGLNESYPISYTIGNYRPLPQKYITVSNPQYVPVLRDSKTGSCYSSVGIQYTDRSISISDANAAINEATRFFLKDGNVIEFDYSTIQRLSPVAGTLGIVPAVEYFRNAAFFAFDNNLYTSEVTYDHTQKKYNILVEKNRVIKYYSELPNLYPFIYPMLINKQYQRHELKDSKLYSEFISAIFENYPDGFTVGYDGNGSRKNLIIPGLVCYSESTKTQWQFCNLMFVPDNIKWEDAD